MRYFLGVSLFSCAILLAELPAFSEEAKWEPLIGAVDVKRHAVAGKWEKVDDTLTVGADQGARIWLPFAPDGEYDFRVTFTRRTGVHSIALIFPRGTGQAVFEVDAWGEHLAGIQNIDGKSIRENATRQADRPLKNGERYTMTVEVRKAEIRALLDDRVIATLQGEGSELSPPDLWRIPERRNLGVGAWDSATTFHRIEARLLSGAPLAVAGAGAPPAKPPAGQPPQRTGSPPRAAKTTKGTNPPPERAVATRPAPTGSTAAKTAPQVTSRKSDQAAGSKRVLLVIANHHFFYREYSEPRTELERAGIKVTVAAGRKAPCRPHPGSGQGAVEGMVQPDIALADAKAEDYDAILFSGGWGASAYQFAFNGRYNDPAYNGDKGVKATVNRLINDFTKQDKYVCALCNAVSVLAWARVNGKSPLSGKQVCAPTRQAAPGIYDGQPGQPSCRWHPESNGAKLSPAGSIGRPDTAEDDVLVDGKIVTGEDDISAREMGRRIAQLLSAE